MAAENPNATQPKTSDAGAYGRNGDQGLAMAAEVVAFQQCDDDHDHVVPKPGDVCWAELRKMLRAAERYQASLEQRLSAAEAKAGRYEDALASLRTAIRTEPRMHIGDATRDDFVSRLDAALSPARAEEAGKEEYCAHGVPGGVTCQRCERQPTPPAPQSGSETRTALEEAIGKVRAIFEPAPGQIEVARRESAQNGFDGQLVLWADALVLLDRAAAEHAEVVEAFHDASRLRSEIQRCRIQAENERDALRAELEKVKGERDEKARLASILHDVIAGGGGHAHTLARHEHGCSLDRVKLLHADKDAALARVAELEKELERERMRLAACGVVALADTPESAAKARDMHPDYRSASCDDVARRVDECMRLAAVAARLEAAISELKTQAGRLEALAGKPRVEVSRG